MISFAEGRPSVDLPSKFTTWSEIPIDLLRAELVRRQSSTKPACGSTGTKASYNTPLHVFALILILVLSVGACSFPIIVRRFPTLPVPHHFLFLSRHFGTGVLIATAFVHLLPTAFQSLLDPCLPSFWNVGYPAMPGLIAMASVLIVVGIEMFFATRGAGHIHGSEYDSLPSRGHEHMHGQEDRPPRGKIKRERKSSFRRFQPEGLQTQDGPSEAAFGTSLEPTDDSSAGISRSTSRGSLLSPAKTTDDASDESDLELGELGPGPVDGDDIGLLGGQPVQKAYPSEENGHIKGVTRSRSTSLSAQQNQQKMLLQCLLLEAGILFHSVFIGMALSVATGTSFIVLLVAISFHQTFEGLALGSRIAALAFPPRSVKPWLMALAYGTTTPFGQAIGLAIHTLYDPASQTGLLTVGVMNAISSGLLLFAGLVELLAEDFLSDESYKTLTGRRRAEACASVVGGAGLMALVGAWA